MAVFEEVLRDTATRLADVDHEKGGLAKRIDSYHTQEDNYRRHASELVDFSARAGSALAQAVKDALASVELLNKVWGERGGGGRAGEGGTDSERDKTDLVGGRDRTCGG